MNDVQDFINKAVEGLKLTEAEKQALLGIYLVDFYSACFRYLLVLNAKNPKFLKNLNETFDSYINALSASQKEAFNKTIEEQRADILAKILSQFSSKLTPELKQKVDDNIAKYTSNK